MRLRAGIGGKVGPVRAGVSNRGIGGGLGAFSAGASWRAGGPNLLGAIVVSAVAVGLLVEAALWGWHIINTFWWAFVGPWIAWVFFSVRRDLRGRGVGKGLTGRERRWVWALGLLVGSLVVLSVGSWAVAALSD